MAPFLLYFLFFCVFSNRKVNCKETKLDSSLIAPLVQPFLWEKERRFQFNSYCQFVPTDCFGTLQKFVECTKQENYLHKPIETLINQIRMVNENILIGEFNVDKKIFIIEMLTSYISLLLTYNAKNF